MIFAVILSTGLLLVILIGTYRRVSARLYSITQGLIRIETALGADEWLDMMEEHLSSAHLQRLRREGLVGRLARIEVAVDSTARAKHEVSELPRVLDDELQNDASVAYDHWQVTKIAELLEQGERPDRESWEKWIHTPFPWSVDAQPPNDR